MNEFFNKNNLAMRFLTSICNLILVNLLFLLFSLPIVTIGASLTALYKIVFMMHAKDEIFIYRDFKAEFVDSFKKATIIWVPVLLLSAYFVVELRYLNGFSDMPWLQIPIWIVVFFMACILIYAFPLLANFENSLKNTVKNSILLGLGNLPTTIFVIVIFYALYLSIDYEPAFLVIWGSLAIFMGCAVMAWFIALFLRRIFGIKKIVTFPEDTDKL